MAKRQRAGAVEEPLVFDGGSRPRLRKPVATSWTKAKERRFLQALGESCNVKLASKRAKVSPSTVYVRRAKDARFRDAWDQAVAIGYAQLELMMLERALHGIEKVIVPPRGNGEPLVMREYSDRVGLALLRMHRETARIAGEESEAAEVEEAVERIIARLERMKDSEDYETKAAVSRDRIIRDALRLARKTRGPRSTKSHPGDA